MLKLTARFTLGGLRNLYVSRRNATYQGPCILSIGSVSSSYSVHEEKGPEHHASPHLGQEHHASPHKRH